MSSTSPLDSVPFVAWLAGFTDGEGYIDWSGTSALVLTTTHRSTLEWIQAEVGGSLRQLKRSPKGAIRSSKPAYQLSWTGTRARELLVALVPHLREKRRQAELVLSVTGADGRRRLSEEVWEYRRWVRINLKNLRHGRPEQWPSPDPAGPGGVAGDGLPRPIPPPVRGWDD